MPEFSVYSTSYFSEPSATLDPRLFEGRHLREWVRTGIRHLLIDFLERNFRHPELWAHPWLAGSGVSYQWEAAREPGDLDCLVGVDFIQFRKANPEYSGLTDREIAAELNDEFYELLQPTTANWEGYELTFFVNPSATDIRAIHPYAAYDLKYDEWTVSPDPNQRPKIDDEWERLTQSDARHAQSLYTRFTVALQDYEAARGLPQKLNAQTRLKEAAAGSSALYEELHGSRSLAFSSTGQGYNDFYNYRWQAAKKYGTTQLLKSVYNHPVVHQSSYGTDLPSADTLIRRAALYRNN